MLESAEHVLRYVQGVAFEDFVSNAEKRDAVAMRLAVIGECARHLTAKTEAQLPEVPFSQIRGMRNRIAHDYGQVNHRILWEVSRNDMPPLVDALGRFFRRMS